MGNAHVYSEYKTKWGKEKKYFEQLTAANYIKILFEEYRGKNKNENYKRREKFMEFFKYI